MSALNPPLALAFPLHGSQLIEASAGTGKTSRHDTSAPTGLFHDKPHLHLPS